MGSFPYTLSWEVLPSGRRRLLDEFVYILDDDLAEELGEKFVAAEKKFVTDGGSIPRIFWTFGSPYTGKSVRGYVTHDWLCEHPELCSRYLANKIMLRCHKDSGVNYFWRYAVYASVQAYAIAKGLK